MKLFILRTAITAVALWVVTRLIPGITFDGPAGALLGVALVFGVVNAFLKPLLALLTCPLILLTMGIFMLVINAVLLMLTASLSQALGLGFEVAGFWPAFWGGLVLGIVSAVLEMMTGANDPRGRSPRV